MSSYTTFDWQRLGARSDLVRLHEALRRAVHEVGEEDGGVQALNAIAKAADILRNEISAIEEGAGETAAEDLVGQLIDVASAATFHYRAKHERREVDARDRELDDRSERFRQEMVA